VKTITDDDVLSKCGWTPYAGQKVQGVPVYTFLRGEAILDEGTLALKDGFGKQAVRA
jgi:dihydroorotase-like cyclic amidohydrolase